MKIYSVISANLGIGQSHYAHMVATQLSKDKRVFFLDASTESDFGAAWDDTFNGTCLKIIELLNEIPTSEDSAMEPHLESLVLNDLVEEEENLVFEDSYDCIVINWPMVNSREDLTNIVRHSTTIDIATKSDFMWQVVESFTTAFKDILIAKSNISIVPLMSFKHLGNEFLDAAKSKSDAVLTEIEKFAQSNGFILKKPMAVLDDQLYYGYKIPKSDLSEIVSSNHQVLLEKP